MKKVTLLILNFYINFFSYIVKGVVGANDCCRFSPTCSQYAKNSISEYGVIKGTKLSIVRLFKCQPFYKVAKI